MHYVFGSLSFQPQRACVRACVRACLRACVRACVHLHIMDQCCFFVSASMCHVNLHICPVQIASVPMRALFMHFPCACELYVYNRVCEWHFLFCARVCVHVYFLSLYVYLHLHMRACVCTCVCMCVYTFIMDQCGFFLYLQACAMFICTSTIRGLYKHMNIHFFACVQIGMFDLLIFAHVYIDLRVCVHACTDILT